MKRSIGVTASAVVSLLGSLFVLAIGLLMIFALGMAHRSNQETPAMPLTFIIVLFVSLYLAPSIWGIVTSIGLFRLKNWARISIIIFSVLLVGMGFLSALAIALIPFPVAPNANLNVAVIRAGVIGFWVFLAAFGVWWLILFTRAGVKSQFAVRSAELLGGDPLQAGYIPSFSMQGAAGSKRPLSITIIAWLLIAGCVFLVMSIFLHTPAVFLTKVLVGWQASLLYLVFAGVSLTVAIGLLRLRPLARAVGIVYLGFGLLNSAIFYFAPGAVQRFATLLENQRSLFPWAQTTSMPQWQSIPTGALLFGGIMAIIATGIPIYFLMIHRKAFEEAVATSHA